MTVVVGINIYGTPALIMDAVGTYDSVRDDGIKSPLSGEHLLHEDAEAGGVYRKGIVLQGGQFTMAGAGDGYLLMFAMAFFRDYQDYSKLYSKESLEEVFDELVYEIGLRVAGAGAVVPRATILGWTVIDGVPVYFEKEIGKGELPTPLSFPELGHGCHRAYGSGAGEFDKILAGVLHPSYEPKNATALFSIIGALVYSERGYPERSNGDRFGFGYHAVFWEERLKRFALMCDYRVIVAQATVTQGFPFRFQLDLLHNHLKRGKHFSVSSCLPHVAGEPKPVGTLTRKLLGYTLGDLGGEYRQLSDAEVVEDFARDVPVTVFVVQHVANGSPKEIELVPIICSGHVYSIDLKADPKEPEEFELNWEWSQDHGQQVLKRMRDTSYVFAKQVTET